jgi:peroxiredoxin
MHRRTLIFIIVFVFVAVALFLLFSGFGEAPKKEEAVLPKVEAPNFILPDLSGKPLALSDFRGKVVFVTFWTTWCPSCREDLQTIQKLYNDSDKEKFVILAVNLQEKRNEIKAFAEKHGFTFPILLDGANEVGRKYVVRAIPVTFLVDQEGNVVAKVLGVREWKWDDLKVLVK